MKKEETKHRYIYKIKCLLGEYKGCYYYGQHTTYNLDDGYAGSGVRINEYYNKYGKIEGVTYIKKIVKDGAKTQQQLDKWEYSAIRKVLGKRKCLNMIDGGLDAIRNSNKLHFHTVVQNEDETYHSCELEELSENKQKTIPTYFDETTTKLIKKLKKDKYNFEIRKELTNRLSKYMLTPTLLNL